jgi:hypothetical protein
MVSLEGVAIVVGWLISVSLAVLFAVKVIPERASSRMCEKFGLAEVEQNGKKIYAVLDLQGNPIQVPIGTKEVDGEQQVVTAVVSLPMTMSYLAAEQAAMKVKMALLNMKSTASKHLQQAAMGEAMKGEGGIEAMLPFLPKKAMPIIALMKALGVSVGGQTGVQAGKTTSGSKAL